ncbi:GNAT family N-acetyltransferase [Rhizobium halophytocola]|uniref:RimJ/RimL family protein N-acetyltransferase n=1 Tax=Rhizobium halophytocola TaxID=735519 RepID=A0ABS4E241_9HYPH|nr:GNAT family N-acetyltransferase [Rhizobium halophytocola]MBP1851983.1 RimJ/RimL family protein N-acetyltransferase [Rhizobium halophytocola]
MTPTLEQVHAPASLGPCPFVSTARLTLRPHRMRDADAIAQSLSDFQITRMLARVPLPYGRDDAVDWLNRVNGKASPDWSLAISDENDVHMGVVSVELRHGLWHLGYWLNRSFWGRGYMSEAVQATVERFFRRMPGVTLHSGVFADNPASLRVQEKLGFAVTGSSQVFSVGRNAMVSHIDTALDEGRFRPRSAG